MFFRCDDPESILKQLHGKKHLLVGNHDGSWIHKFDTAKYFKSVSHILETSDGAHAITLCHYLMLTWNHQRKSYMIHGHIHNNTEIDFWPLMIKRGNILNAGVDMNGFKPVPFDELIENNRVFVEDYLGSTMRKAQAQDQLFGL